MTDDQDSITINIHFGETDPEAAVKQLKTALSELSDDGEYNLNGIKYQHSEWTWGEPCPECGHDILWVQEAQPATYYSDNGNIEFRRSETGEDETLSVSCHEPGCFEVLYRSTAGYFIY